VVTVQLKDEDGHNIFGGAYEVRLETDSGQITEPELQDDGTYQAVFSATRPGTAIIRGTVEGAEIGNTAVVEVAVGAADVDRSTITASPTAITTDDSAVVTVQLKDRHGNARATGDDTVEVFVDGEAQLAVEFADGVYTATFIPEKTGTVTFSGTVNGQPLGSTTTVNVTPGAASPDTSTITADPEAITTDGAATITVQLKDAKHNNLTDGGDTVTLTTTHGTLTPVTDNGDGTYTAVFSATTPGRATNSGNVNSADMIDTVDIEVSVGKANTLTSTVTSGEASITAGESTTITVQLKDAHGNALVTGGDSVELETDLGTVTPVVDNDDGTYTATFSSTASGTATIAGKLNGQEIASFVEVEVLPGPADAEQSIMETSASSITTDDSATITVRFKDAHGNCLTAGGDSVELATDLGTLSPVVDQGDGTYTAAFSATTPGRATISGNVNSADMIDTVDIEVSVGKANTLT